MVERECSWLKAEDKEKTNRLSKAKEEMKLNGEALSTAHTELEALKV